MATSTIQDLVRKEAKDRVRTRGQLRRGELTLQNVSLTAAFRLRPGQIRIDKQSLHRMSEAMEMQPPWWR